MSVSLSPSSQRHARGSTRWRGSSTSTRERLKRGVFCSVVELQEAINRYVVETNTRSKPFTWTGDPDEIIAAVRREHQVLDSIHEAAF